jgi:hypothetical protein
MDMMHGALGELLFLQWSLQVDSFDLNPQALDGDARAEFVRWNVLALEDELHEALQECGWKPWATDRSMDGEAMLKELVDALHFFMNLALVAGAHLGSPQAVGHRLVELYLEKRDVNAQRQADGYTGTDKCPQCKRDKATTIILKHNVLLDELHFCPCGYSYDRPEPKPVDEEADRVRRASL